ncbi:MAG: TIGR01459 family HAD-type hydrolase [Paracoccaceae bacterium]
MTEIIQNLAQISHRYEALFVDLWGCVHNGIKAYPEAVAALVDYRATTGGKVILVTNSPRPRAEVADQIAAFGVPDHAWDDIATSGDSARAAMFQGAVGSKVYHIGTPDETGFFEPLKIIDNPSEITLVPLDQAEGIVCTGPFDPFADPATYRPQFLLAKERGLKMLCANPDIVVDRGDSREWCAGALAELYTEMGGESLYFGKPHPPIYDLARKRLRKHASVDDSAILCIGDGIHTDISGGIGEGLDTLFITGGLAAADFGPDVQNPDPTLMARWFDTQQIAPMAAIPFLR